MNPLELTITIPIGILPDRAVLAQELRAAAQQLLALAAEFEREQAEIERAHAIIAAARGDSETGGDAR